jgi:RNA polymerase sigma factor (sigma-70 family)
MAALYRDAATQFMVPKRTSRSAEESRVFVRAPGPRSAYDGSVTTAERPTATRTAAAPAVFVTTHWSVVLTAAEKDTTRAQEALGYLCRMYWYPIYHFVRRQGHSVHDAQDLTQEFFARLLEKNWIAHADQSRGRFRSFLLLVLKRFLAGEWHKAHAQKRAGDRCVPLPLDTAETRYAREPADTATPEQAFEKQWALTLLETVLGQLRAEYEQDGKGRWFEALKPCLLGSRESQPYAELAVTLAKSEGAVKVAVHRLRERYRERLKAEIANTVASPADVDAELRHLFRVLGRG